MCGCGQSVQEDVKIGLEKVCQEIDSYLPSASNMTGFHGFATTDSASLYYYLRFLMM